MRIMSGFVKCLIRRRKMMMDSYDALVTGRANLNFDLIGEFDSTQKSLGLETLNLSPLGED
jgi:hypothetical protein